MSNKYYISTTDKEIYADVKYIFSAYLPKARPQARSSPIGFLIYSLPMRYSSSPSEAFRRFR